MANHCKIFTPYEYVIELLDAIKYKTHLYGQSVLENSCGDGHILIEVVHRYIKSCLQEKRTLVDIKEGLERDIYGIELEKEHAENCICNLELVANQYGIENVKWLILQENYLSLDWQKKFSFVIGNPPYIVYRDIEEEERSQLKKKFTVCKEGKFDYYYAFLEKGTYELNDVGKLAYIIPSSIYKNVFANNLREFLKPLVSEIYDYTSETKFPGVTTSSTILILDKAKKHQKLIYRDVVNEEIIKITKSILKEKWNFRLHDLNQQTQFYKFGDYYKVSNTIATLCNKAFLLDNITEEDKFYFYNNGRKIEKTVVKDAISRKRSDKRIKIIFPYYFEKDVLKRYEENVFIKCFPEAAEYIKSFAEDINKRKADKSAKWYEYGRSQAIAHMNKEKLLLPSILTANIKAFVVGKDVIPCAGVYITVKKKRTLEEAKRLLESEDFYRYLNGIGIFTTGKSRRVSVYDIENYTFSNWE